MHLCSTPIVSLVSQRHTPGTIFRDRFEIVVRVSAALSVVVYSSRAAFYGCPCHSLCLNSNDRVPAGFRDGATSIIMIAQVCVRFEASPHSLPLGNVDLCIDLVVLPVPTRSE